MRKPDTFTLLGGLLILAAAGSYVATYLGREKQASAPGPAPAAETPARGFDPLSPAAHWDLADRLEKADRIAEAERVRRAARRLGGENVPEPAPVGGGEGKSAEVLSLTPVEGASGAADALELASKGDLDAALAAARKLVEEDGETPVNLTALGYILTYRAEPAEAEKALSRAIEIEEAFAPAVLGRGVVRLRSGRWRDAVEDLEKACRMAPEALPWRLELARALLGASKIDAALEHLEYVLRRQPAVPEVYRMVGDCLLRGGREEEARRWYRATILLGGPEAVPEEVRRFAEGAVTEGS